MKLQDDYDAGDEGQVKRRKTKAQLEHENQVEEFKELLESEGGRYFVWRLLSLCGVYRAAPFENIERFEGARDVGLHVIEWIREADPESIGLMQLEALRRENG